MRTTLAVMLILVAQTIPATASVYVTTDGDTTRIWDTDIQWSCSAQFMTSTRLSGDTIYVTERDTMRLVTCLCYFNVCSKVTGLQPGVYTIVVTRRFEQRILDSIHVYEERAGEV